MALNRKFTPENVYPPGGCDEWYIPTKEVVTKLDLPTATGADLDKLGELWGLKRDTAIDPMYGNPTVESDNNFRHRIKSYALDAGFINPNIVDPNSIDFSELEVIGRGTENEEIVKKNVPTQKCECGVASLGYTQPGPGHASYCPLVAK